MADSQWLVKQRTNARIGNATDQTGPEDTPETRWQFTVDGYGKETRVKSSPVVADDIVYFGAKDGRLYAVDIYSGSVEWMHEMNDQSAWGAPAIVDNTVIIGSFDNYIHAVDRRTGQRQWTFKTADQVRSSIAVGTVSNRLDLVLAGSRDGHLYALHSGNGYCRWKFEAAGEVRSTPTIKDNTVYFGCEKNKLYALNLDDGSKRWCVDGPGSGVLAAIQQAPAIMNDRLFVVGYSFFSDLHALSLHSGNTLWTYEVDDRIESSPAVTDETVYFGSRDAQVYAVDTVNGNQKWVASVGGKVSSSPIVTDSTIYVGCDDEQLYALNRYTGDVRWKYNLGGKIKTSPAIVEDTLFISSYAGVHALESESAKVYNKQKKGTVCSACKADLSEYGDVTFCPECGDRKKK